MHFLYILYSKNSDRFYIGETHELEQRVQKHNQHNYENSFTKIALDWEIALSFKCQNREQALFLENFIKKMKSKVFIRIIITNPEILTDILSKM